VSRFIFTLSFNQRKFLSFTISGEVRAPLNPRQPSHKIMAVALNNLQNRSVARRSPLILVADDDEDTRFLFRTILEMQGYSVIEAADGEVAVHLAEREGPDLIMMDGSLPRLDGYDAARRIRLLRHVRQMPIVFVSGHAEPSFLTLAREAGGDEYLVKPCGINQIGGVLEKYLGRSTPVFATNV
jgi:CheY-like chemotaxis protein